MATPTRGRSKGCGMSLRRAKRPTRRTRAASSGNYSKEWRQRIEELSDQGIIFVRASRVTNSIIFKDDYFDPKHVCLGANNLSPYKARILLMLSLTITKDKKVINDYFLNY